MDDKYINKNYLEDSIKDYDTTIIDPIRNVVSNIYYDTANSFNALTQLIVAIIPSSSYSPAIYWNVASDSLSNTFKGIKYITPVDTTGYNISSGSANPVYAKVNGDYLEFSSNLPIIDTLSQRIFNTNMDNTFKGCTNLNQNILIPSGVTDMKGTFNGCLSLDQNILIPNTVTNLTVRRAGLDISGTFSDCITLNMPIAIPNSVTDMSLAFKDCISLYQDDMYIYSQNITRMNNAYRGVQYIGNIHIPTSVPKDTSNFMYNCLVNGTAGYTFAPENIINDLPVDIAQWPPV